MRTEVHTAERGARRAATSPAMTKLARLGYTIKGVVYVVIGVLALLLATGHGGSVTDQTGALKAIYGSPLGEGFGRFLMVVITIGLFAFALWSLIQALFDTEGKGRQAKGIIARIGYAAVGVTYGLLGYAAYQIASTGNSSKNSTSSAQNWTALLLKQPAGVALVIIVGIAVLVIAVVLFVRAYKASFQKYLNLSTVKAQTRQMIIRVGRIGYAAIGVVFTIIGIFLIVAAVKNNPQDAKGLDSALVALVQQPFGPWLLGLVALGLIAYGVYSFVEARYRRLGWS
jgi:hypothetical protein